MHKWDELAIRLWRGLNKHLVRRAPLAVLGVRQRPYPYTIFGSSDGAWPVPDGILSCDSVCYCVGVGRDISFDLDLHRQHGCSVYSFDPTPSSIEYVESFFKIPISFKPWGLWNEDTTLSLYPQQRNSTVNLSTVNTYRGQKTCDIKCFRLKTIMDKLGHDRINLLKIDIEGAWLEVIEDMVNSHVVPDIFCVEFDSPTSVLRVRKAVSLLKKIGLNCITRQKDNYCFALDRKL